MAWTKSGIYYTSMLALLQQTALTGETRGTGLFRTTTNKIALHGPAASMTDGTAPINYSAASPTWANTNEVSGTGWAAGGELVSGLASGGASLALAWSESPTGSAMLDGADIVKTGTTLTTLAGCIMYADAITATLIDAMVLGISFGANYSTVAGTLTVTWDTLGLAAIDLTP